MGSRTTAPRRRNRVDAALGGVVTAQSVLGHVAQNIDKVLLGRFRGADALGIYGRAYQLVSMPMTNLNAAVGWMAFSALSRIPGRSSTVPKLLPVGLQRRCLTGRADPCLCGVFADDTVRVVLGPQWADVALIIQLLAPAGWS